MERVADRDLPDPFVMRDGATWWLYATGSGGDNLQVASSPDLRSWGPSSDPLPVLPRWAAPGSTWSPAVLARNGRFVYYAVRDAVVGRECVSAAVATTPAGPFVDASAGPMVCQTSSGGSIDPSPFVAPDGTAYLLWKSDDNALGTRARIGGQRLNPDGLSLAGPRPAMLVASAPWEGGVVEGPAMVMAGARYYLFYGANHWDTAGAAIGYAVCSSPLGPCTNGSASRPWLATQGPDRRAERSGPVRRRRGRRPPRLPRVGYGRRRAAGTGAVDRATVVRVAVPGLDRGRPPPPPGAAPRRAEVAGRAVA